MYVVIAGGGRLGARLADSLLMAGHEIFVIDTSEVVVGSLRARFGSIALFGDATSNIVLTEAGMSRADIFVASTDDDASNLAACQLAKIHFGVERTVAVAKDPDNVRLFEILGVDDVISSTDLMLSRVSGVLPAHPLVRLMPITGRNKEVIGIKIPTGSVVVGKPLREVGLPYGSLISLVIGVDGSTEIPTQETVLDAEDEIVAVSPLESTYQLYQTITELKTR